MRVRRPRSRTNHRASAQDPSSAESAVEGRAHELSPFRYSAAFLNKWADETGVGGDLLVLAQHVDSNPGRNIVGRTIPSAGTHAKVTLVAGVDGVVCQIGSANLTPQGLGGEFRDVFITASANRQTGERALCSDVCDWLVRRLDALPFPVPGGRMWRSRIRELLEVLGQGRSTEWRLWNNDATTLGDQLAPALSRVQDAVIFSIFAFLQRSIASAFVT